MTRALIIKELRECLPVAAIAAAAAAWMLHIQTGGNPWPGLPASNVDPQPFLDGNWWLGLPFVAGVLAAVLGVKQMWWDDLRGHYHFLLHRPASRSRIFLIKIGVGLMLVQAIGAAMILIFAAWAATPGTHASPCYWDMTLPAWQAWLAMPVVYAGAALTGLRPARWYGSRLLPLVASIGVAVMVVAPSRLWMSVVVLAVALGVFIALNLYVAATRDY